MTQAVPTLEPYVFRSPYETVLPPSAVADLMISMYWRMAGRDAAEGRSVFGRPGGGTRVGERLGSRAEVLGGVVLILIGLRILLDHLGVL